MATIEELQSEIERLKGELAHKNALFDVLFNENPDGVVVSDATGKVISNPTSMNMLGAPSAPDAIPAQWTTEFGFFGSDGKTPIPVEELPLMRSLMRGEIVVDFEMFIRSVQQPNGVWIAASSRPLAGGGAISVFRDTTEQKRLTEELAKRHEELAARSEENTELVARLRAAVDELSTPVLEVWRDVLAVPIVGVLDTQRSARMSERVLEEVCERGARFVIVDLTGVEVVDTATADHLLKMALAIGLLGCDCVVTGIQPAVAQALFQIGVDFGRLRTFSNLKRAIEYCMDAERAGSSKAEKALDAARVREQPTEQETESQS